MPCVVHAAHTRRCGATERMPVPSNRAGTEQPRGSCPPASQLALAPALCSVVRVSVICASPPPPPEAALVGSGGSASPLKRGSRPQSAAAAHFACAPPCLQAEPMGCAAMRCAAMRCDAMQCDAPRCAPTTHGDGPPPTAQAHSSPHPAAYGGSRPRVCASSPPSPPVLPSAICLSPPPSHHSRHPSSTIGVATAAAVPLPPPGRCACACALSRPANLVCLAPCLVRPFLSCAYAHCAAPHARPSLLPPPPASRPAAA